MRNFRRVAYRRLFVVLTAGLVAAAATLTLLALAAMQTDLIGPPGSGSFGQQVVVLANGNIVVTDPGYDSPGPITDTGAVYLYNGATGALISQLTGSTAYDYVGAGGVTALSNNNYVVRSPYWANGVAMNAGAVTWGNGTTGITGTVSAANSLVGSKANDKIGEYSVEELSNGNYVVLSPWWDNGPMENVGAVTWGNGTMGIKGAVSVTNSLVGSATYDVVGYSGVAALNNGNYVVPSPDWDNGTVTDAGAATWGNGTTGITGVVSVTNSLVGTTMYDNVGKYVSVLTNGNYVVRSPVWDNGTATSAGAVTWGNGTTGITGVVSITNSLVGNTMGDHVGWSGFNVLTNGNYVVYSSDWDNGAAMDVGAITWVNGTTGITGVISITNSLVGSTAQDMIFGGIRVLTNSNYVVCLPLWDNGAVVNAGAATWGNGTIGITGTVSIINSLVGSTTDDRVGSYDRVVALTNGNYVVLSSDWDNGALENVGAVTWRNGATGIMGAVSITNSLVGSTTGDRVGDGGITALINGNYVVSSPRWDNGATTDVGAATWENGTTGITGVISITNSLVGNTSSDMIFGGVRALSNGNYVVFSPGWDNGTVENVGAATWGNGATGITGVVSITNSLVGSTAGDGAGDSITALSNGNYVVRSYGWDNGVATDVGAATWGNGATGIMGVVSITNSLVGSTIDDRVGFGLSGLGVTALSNGKYVVHSPSWDNGATTDAGAVTLGDGRAGTIGHVAADNSVRGSVAGSGSSLNFGYDYIHNQLVVGRPADKIVTLFRIPFPYQVYLPLVRK